MKAEKPNHIHSLPLRLHLNEPEGRMDNCATHYPDTSELLPHIADMHGMQVEHVCLTAGADNAIEVACRSCNPGSTVVLLEPDFARYRDHAKNCGLFVKSISLGPPPFSFPAKSLLSSITDETSLTILSSVGNPSGYEIPDGLLQEIHARAPRCLIVIDEVYSPFIHGDHTVLARNTLNIISVRSLSKVGYPGLRVGYIVGHPDTLGPLRPFVSPFGIGSLSVEAARDAIRNRSTWSQTISRQIEAREWVVAELSRRNIETLASPANWVLVRFGEAVDNTVQDLANRGILVQRQTHPALEGWLRISTPDVASMGELVSAIDDILDPPFVELEGVLKFKQDRISSKSLANESFVTTLYGELAALDHLVLTVPDRAAMLGYIEDLVSFGGNVVEGPGLFPGDFCRLDNPFPSDLAFLLASVSLPRGTLVLASPHHAADQLGRFRSERGSAGIHHVAVTVTDLHEAAAHWSRKGFVPLPGPQDDGQLAQWFLRNSAGQLVELIHRRSVSKATFSCTNIGGLRRSEEPT